MARKGLDVQIDGADALIKFFEEVSSSVEQIVSEEIEATVQDIRTDALLLVPVDTGRLRSSITAESNGMYGEVRTNVEYAGYVEWGTGGQVDVPDGWEDIAEQWRGKGERTINMPPRPFMKPALEKNVPLMLERMTKRIGGE